MAEVPLLLLSAVTVFASFSLLEPHLPRSSTEHVPIRGVPRNWGLKHLSVIVVSKCYLFSSHLPW